MNRKVVATNRRARYDYEIVDRFEAGIVLLGSEVKSLRAGQADLKDSFASFRGGELWLDSVRIAPYKFARDGGHEPERSRKLLMHRSELDRIAGRMQEKGLTLVPLAVYFSGGVAKVELALARGKRQYDKRQAIRTREQEREMERAKRWANR